MITLLIAFLYFIASEVKYSCRYCAKKFHNITALRRHTQDIHIKKDLSYPSVCIDVQRGVFMVAVAQSGPIAPVHIQKHTQKQLLYCEDKDCQDIMKATKDINPSVECKHLQAVANAHILDEHQLSLAGLDELSRLNLVSTSSKSACEQLWLESIEEKYPLVVSAPFDELGYSSRQKYYSVYTSKRTYYSRLNRVRVTFDSQTGEWSCTCPMSTSQRSCVHETASKWYMLQRQAQFFENCKHRFIT